MHSATRHVERWAPETSTSKVRSMRSLGFVDRLVSPWLETAQRSSAGLRMFSSQFSAGRSGQSNERSAPGVSWVFPRPWFQDELDWMAAARNVGSQSEESTASPSLFTTRGTYVAPQAQLRPTTSAMPAPLFEYVAPSLSVAQPPRAASRGFDASSASASFGPAVAPPQQAFSPVSSPAFSPLVSLAAVQAAEIMSRTVAPLVGTSASAAPSPAAASIVTPQLRNVLTAMLERASAPTTLTSIADRAPQMVTPPHPTAEAPASEAMSAPQAMHMTPAMQVADSVAVSMSTHRAQLAQLQAIAHQAQQREAATRAASTAPTASTAPQTFARPAPVAEAAPPQMPASAPDPTVLERVVQQAIAERTQAQAAAAERQRVEERVQQRIAERQAAQRLHEQARAEAALHVHSLEQRREAPAAVEAPRPPAELLAALAALPPQLASMIDERALTRPGGAVAAIAQVNEALRTAELIARSQATNTVFEPTRGPRLMMPAGMGGLVSAVERAHAPVVTPAMQAQAQAQRAQQLAARAPAYRVPTLPFMMPAAQQAPLSTTSALGATSSAQPQALSHVAWADRWLARFAGANPASLSAISAASSASPLAHLASIAPSAVFVSPMFDSERETPVASMPAPSSPFVSSSTGGMGELRPMPRLIPTPSAPIERFDDSAETPDDVFAQIAASASSSRRGRESRAAAPEMPVVAPSAPFQAASDRGTYADHLAHVAPSAPAAGLAAQLASSPFAPALRHVLALPSAESFDVRSLFGGALGASYLAGVLEPSAHEMEVASPLPAWAQWSPAATELGGFADIGGDIGSDVFRDVPGFDPAYVAPSDIGADLAVGGGEYAAPAAAAAPGMDLAPLTTLRSALLSWSAELGPSGIGSVSAPSIETAATQIMAQPSQARSILSAMSMPMLGETEPDEFAGWTQPGGVADRAFGYSLAHERSTADLSFDFVPPELVLAARVYGLGPAEAAQAARLALAGPGQLTAMASTVDRTFVQAMAIDAERRDGRESAASSAAGYTPSTSAPGYAGSTAAMGVSPAMLSSLALPGASEPSLIGSAAHSAFGVDRRSPRGAFLWPSATVAALGLSAAAPDGEQSMSVAALELLAAQAVAEIGTYAALDDNQPGTDVAGTPTFARGALAAAQGMAPAMPMLSGLSGAPTTETTAEQGEPGEAEVLSAASALVSASRRARFDALYVALSQTSSGRGSSPAARAARALALAGRGDDAPMSAFERAASVWDVLPVVYATEGMSTEEAVQTQAELGANTPRGIAARAALRGPGSNVNLSLVSSELRPGLSSLSTRAGEALGAYVTQVTPSPVTQQTSATSTSYGTSQAMPPALRAPSAAQELVQTGRPAGRHGGGEAEIPPWFEAAARKMLGERHGSDGISLAELTLVNAAPASHIAASSRSAASPPIAPSSGSATGGGPDKPDGDDIDIDAVADEVYRHVVSMMDAARQRNGEPY